MDKEGSGREGDRAEFQVWLTRRAARKKFWSGFWVAVIPAIAVNAFSWVPAWIGLIQDFVRRHFH